MTLRRRLNALQSRLGEREKVMLVRHVWDPADGPKPPNDADRYGTEEEIQAEAERLEAEGLDVHLVIIRRAGPPPPDARVNREGGDGHRD